MPSPIAHAAMGYVVYRAFRSWRPYEASRHVGPLPQLLVAAVGLSVLPDVDSVIGLLMGDLGRYHNNLMNSFGFGLMVALGAGTAVWLKRRSGFKRWFVLALVCYELHVLMDFLTLGRGVMLAWPLSHQRFESSVKLFYGLHWSDGLLTPKHAVTLVTEIGVVAAAIIIRLGLSRVRPTRG